VRDADGEGCGHAREIAVKLDTLQATRDRACLSARKAAFAAQSPSRASERSSSGVVLGKPKNSR
jgi:hypothetical protein